MRFDQCVEVILDFEGGYVFDSRDSGGETNFGISKRAFPHIDIKNLTKDQARALYKMHYWDKILAPELPPRLRLTVFDTAVNMGVDKAICILQGCLTGNKVGLPVKIDGKIGPVTISACKSVGAQTLLDSFTLVRILMYTKISNFSVFGKSWTHRTLECYKIGTAWGLGETSAANDFDAVTPTSEGKTRKREGLH